jgi:nitroreductase
MTVSLTGIREALIAQLAGRHSTPPRRLVAPAPSEPELDTLMRVALAAPAHGGLRNFRIIRIAETARPALCDLFEAAEREMDPQASEEALARAREKASHAPLLLLFIVRAFEGHPDIPVLEQHASAGAALGGLLHAAQVLGYGAMAVSGHKLSTSVFRSAFALDAHEEALCFVALGTPSGPTRSKVREAPETVLSLWPATASVNHPAEKNA